MRLDLASRTAEPMHPDAGKEGVMTTVDQQTRRRTMRTGLTARDPERACPG